jgi:hypothetical protein
LSFNTFLTASGGLVPVLLTVYLAGRLQRRLTGAFHRTMVLTFLLVMGSVLLVKTLV